MLVREFRRLAWRHAVGRRRLWDARSNLLRSIGLQGEVIAHLSAPVSCFPQSSISFRTGKTFAKDAHGLNRPWANRIPIETKQKRTRNIEGGIRWV